MSQVGRPRAAARYPFHELPGKLGLTGAEALAGMLAQRGCEIAFGYVGTTELALCHALGADGKVRVVNALGDREAVFLAAGANRLPGHRAVAVLHSARGLTNALGAIADARRSEAPVLCVCMLICMFSLVGIPPFGGFVGKLMIFNSLVIAADIHWFMWVVLIFGGLNTVFSLFYYLRVLKAMFIEPRPDGARIARVPLGSPAAWYALIVSVPALLLGVAVGWLSDVANVVASSLFQ